MNRQIFFMLAIVLILLPSPAKATMITFEETPNGDPIDIPHEPPTLITDEFLDWGVIFQNETFIHQHSVPADAPSPDNTILCGSYLNNNGVTFDAYFVLPGQPSVLGTVPWFEITQDKGAQSGGGTLEAYDIDGNLVDSVTFHTSGGTFRVESTAGIHRVYVGACSDDLDNFTYGVIVPEPCTLLLVSLGSLVLIKNATPKF